MMRKTKIDSSHIPKQIDWYKFYGMSKQPINISIRYTYYNFSLHKVLVYGYLLIRDNR